MNAPPEPAPSRDAATVGRVPRPALPTDFARPLLRWSPYPSPANAPGSTADHLPGNRGLK
jgi:hypothetical protein